MRDWTPPEVGEQLARLILDGRQLGYVERLLQLGRPFLECGR